jgi:methylisocitrate lyase
MLYDQREGNHVDTEGQLSPGARFRSAVEQEHPLQVIGAINAYTARMAQATGFRALYLSGGGVAANSLGMPDLGISSMEDVLVDVRRITEVITLPLLVDIVPFAPCSEPEPPPCTSRTR